MLRFGAVSPVSEQQAEAARSEALGTSSATRRCSKFEFSEGGDKIYLRFDKPVEPHEIADVAEGDRACSTTQVQRFGRAEDNTYEVILVGLDIEVQARARRQARAPARCRPIPAVESVGAKAGSELRDDGIKSLLFAILLIMVYIAFRFDFRYGPGTVVALLHDAMIVDRAPSPSPTTSSRSPRSRRC